jgi:hypothetical protein
MIRELSFPPNLGDNSSWIEESPLNCDQIEAEGLDRSFPCPRDVTGFRYLVCIYEDTGEASVVLQAHGGARSEEDQANYALAKMAPYVDAEGELDCGPLIQNALDQESNNLRRANQRAAKNCRQYCVKNRLTKMWTFTFTEEQWDKTKVKRLMNDFLIRWRANYGGQPFPYLYVIELHPEGHGYHVHVAVPGSLFTDFYRLRRVWGHGRIRFDKSKRQSGESRDDSRRLAVYLAKYFSKAYGDEHQSGEHRYEPAQGFNVEVHRRSFKTFREADEFLAYQVIDESFRQVWSDYEVENWCGPPVWLYLSVRKR